MNLKDVVKNRISAPPCDHHLNVQVSEAEGGLSRGTWKVTEEMINGNGVAMGGFSGAAADIMFAYAITSLTEENEGFSSISLNTTFLKPIMTGDVEIICQIHKKGRSIAYGSAKLKQNEKIVAESTTSIMITQK